MLDIASPSSRPTYDGIEAVPTVDFNRIAQSRAAEREETAAMIRELTALRAAFERSEALEASEHERAEAAESREPERRKVAERREWAMAAMTLIAMIAAVIAIFAG